MCECVGVRGECVVNVYECGRDDAVCVVCVNVCLLGDRKEVEDAE